MKDNRKPIILNVDDDAAGRYIITRILQQAGFEVQEGATGRDALRLAEECPDLILLDVNLPDISGFEVCRQIRANRRTAAIPVVHLSATSVGGDDRAAGLEEGADGYLTQPVEPKVLVATINAFLRLKAGELKLREAERQWQSTFNAMNDAVCLIDTDQKILRCNSAMAALAGVALEDLIGRHCWEVSHGTTEPVPECPTMRMRISNRRERVELQQGDSWFDVTVDPLLDEKQTLQGAVHIMRDITERKRAEKEREKLEAQLLQARKMESVGRLAGGVAHEFNNMLSVILGNTEMALEQVDPAQPLHAELQDILTAARRSRDITHKLLAFARMQAVAPKVLGLNETVEGMLKVLRQLIGEDIDLAWRPKAGLWPVKMDPSQIDQIVVNLCVNARDAISLPAPPAYASHADRQSDLSAVPGTAQAGAPRQAGGVGKVTIETDKATFDEAYCADHAGFVPGEFALLVVSDSGCGMDKEILDNIFDPFFTTKGMGRGTGLGLATVYGIVKQNNGFINVYSEPEKGTTIRIYLPRHADEAEEIGAEGAEEILKGRGETMLLVEDDPAIMKMGKMMLKKLGYQVLAASTPGEAMRLAEEHAGGIHLLITDVVMPEMNGRDLAERLHSRYPDLKVLFMSGYTADVIAHQGVLDKGVHFMQKPFSMKDLARKVREALGRSDE